MHQSPALHAFWEGWEASGQVVTSGGTGGDARKIAGAETRRTIASLFSYPGGDKRPLPPRILQHLPGASRAIQVHRQFRMGLPPKYRILMQH